MNNTPSVISIDGVDYVKKGEECIPLRETRIIVADKGWVFAGKCEDLEDGSVTIHNAKNIRIWGTTKGLGELINGPIADKTKFDEYGTVRCTPILQIAVKSGW